jgi:excisionase family DNA binding protein
MQQLMTLKEVMAITRLGKSTLYRLKDEGVLPAVKLPGLSKVVFHPEDVRRFIDSGRQPSAN